MDSDEVFSFSSLTYLYLKQKRTKREHWVHPINCERYTNGHYVKLYYKLREDSSKFFNYFRMSVRSFDELLLCIKNDIQLQNTNMRLAIQPEEMLVITLRYVGIFVIKCTLIKISYYSSILFIFIKLLY